MLFSAISWFVAACARSESVCEAEVKVDRVEVEGNMGSVPRSIKRPAEVAVDEALAGSDDDGGVTPEVSRDGGGT
jgi:hypothetical protein